MDSSAFLGVVQGQDPRRWTLPVEPHVATWAKALFGGTALGAAIAAMEGTGGRPCIWATGQYLSYARLGEVVEIEVTLAVDGHQVTQARAVGRVGDREILTVNAALGERPGIPSHQFEQIPDVEPPAAYPLRVPRFDAGTSINSLVEQRLVKGRQYGELDGLLGDGQTIIWARMPEGIDRIDTAALAVLGDLLPSGVGQALGRLGGGNSLDNTLRVVRLVPTEWVLLDIRVHAVDHGFGHGLVHMFAEDGTLLATGSQTCIVRFWKDRPDT